MNTMRDEWVARARAADMLEVAARLGAKLRRCGHEHAGPCPSCNGTDRFSINVQKRVWNCRGAKGGHDAIGMVEHILGCSFLQACEEITGEPPPGAGSGAMDPEVGRERARERREAAHQRDAEIVHDRQRKALRAADVWEVAKPIRGTHAEAYLMSRGIVLLPDQSQDLRFCASLPYRGYADKAAEDENELGAFPAMVAAIRDWEGGLIGVHRTYLDPRVPRKLVPPGDQRRNKAKKVFGNHKGGLIRLGPIGELLAVGEGIETTLGWGGLPEAPAYASLAAGVAIGNISGGATGTIPHPKEAGRTIQNGEPDPNNAGMILPPEVRRLILLGDGDSDGPTTAACLMTAGRRFTEQGLEVMVHMAPIGKDFGDVALEAMRSAA